jgi:hypothetical protein
MDLHLIDACATLLGPQARKAGQAFLHQLDISVIRQAYRRLAVASHPDAAARSGAKPDGRRFIEASMAYELLMGYLLKRPRPAPVGAARAKPRPAPAKPRPAQPKPQPKPAAERPSAKKHAGPEKKASGEKTASGAGAAGGSARTAGPGASARAPLYYHGPVPRRQLRLAEFLYYSGRVSWQSLIASIVWQRTAKPKFGELAKELHAITGRDLVTILRNKRYHEQTGETARRLRLLSADQVSRILRLQRARHKPIGKYFVEKERMPSAELARILWELFRHNARFEREAKGA